ncbi:Coenzyme F420 hydrogenase/dehydrogenase, beta subunit C-terminal domain [Sphingomonas antarctica]|uniref:Coenzyme F420 hydrogenase/dehydrogenase, beta subunit C-terminal domain n=1 Tax=Sphingomonas antarctica TaxID=2040274 RepID=UPI0039EA0DAC
MCASVAGDAVTLELAEPGFIRPRQIATITADAECRIARACPGAEVAPWGDGANVHPAWGPLGTVATGHTTDDRLRHAASSGGMISALLDHALTSGTVDAVVQTRADTIDPVGNMTVISTSPAEVEASAGSRYAPSAPLGAVEDLLAGTTRYAFVGKPCDVSALRQLGTIDPRVAERFPVMLAFFCGGIPSRAGSHEVVRAMGYQPPEVTAFRYRGNGWPGEARATRADGSFAEMNYADSWGAHLSKHVQFRCKICPDAVGGVADIACADAWYGGESGYPQFDEAAGRSLVIARTPAGERLLASAVAANGVVIEPLDPREIVLMQPAQQRRKALLVARFAALSVTGQSWPRVHGLRVLQAARLASIGLSLRNFLGTARRVMQGRK